MNHPISTDTQDASSGAESENPNISMTERANALRALAMDAVQRAKSGHPGAPLGMAEMAVALWSGHLRHNPSNPNWADRDRFVLSNGHGSMLLYALLHLTGYDLSLEQLQRFRQLHSETPGHPEYRITPGVETTTGPLGQGLANGVGFALAEKLLADEFNRAEHDIVDHYTYVFTGDGCLMEGISHEVCSLAGVLRLNKLIVLYDDNGISIDGEVQDWFADDTDARFKAYGWQVIGPLDGHDVVALGRAIGTAKQSSEQPTLIRCRTLIGKGAPNRQGTAKAHGEPLGEDEIAQTREALAWPHPPFEIPDTIRRAWDATDLGIAREQAWQEKFDRYRDAFPALAAEFSRRVAGELTREQCAAVQDMVSDLAARGERVASRRASQQAIECLSQILPELLGGSADLTGSNLTAFPGSGAVRGGKSGGRHINYGVREFGMSAIMNGIALHGGFIPYGGTFLTFSDYSRNALRMAALMKQRSIHVLTHDSIGLGEDGPTHQPIEHAASLRLIPNLDVWRPADQAETGVAWASAIYNTDRPTALLLSRQSLPPQPRSATQTEAIKRGGYVLSEHENAQASILATGSEVALAMQAQALLATQNINVRVVSMPSASVFDRQDESYRNAVLGNHALPRIGVEAGTSTWWYRYACDAVLGIDSFGESAPGQQVFEHFGFTAENLAELVVAQLKGD